MEIDGTDPPFGGIHTNHFVQEKRQGHDDSINANGETWRMMGAIVMHKANKFVKLNSIIAASAAVNNDTDDDLLIESAPNSKKNSNNSHCLWHLFSCKVGVHAFLRVYAFILHVFNILLILFRTFFKYVFLH